MIASAIAAANGQRIAPDEIHPLREAEGDHVTVTAGNLPSISQSIVNAGKRN